MILWFGQMVSTIGSAMTYFALTLWIWQQTESVTAIALVSFFFQLPQIALALVSGVIVDRFDRKNLIVLGDIVAAVCTLSVGLLSATENLLLWHLYAIAGIYGCFGHLQELAYSTVVPQIVPQQHYTRASSLGALVTYSAEIVAPAFAGSLYPNIGLSGIIWIDLTTFAFAIATLFTVHIPKPDRLEIDRSESILQTLTFGFRYIKSQSSLLATAIVLSLFVFAHQLGETLYEPMILARTNGNSQILGTVVTAAGLGGALGAALLSAWGGFRRQVRGMLVGMIGTGLSKVIFGFGRMPFVWIGTQFSASLFTPLVFSSYTAVWYAKVQPALQGRVFAADHLIGLVVGAIASLIVGPLADRIFEPALQSNGQLARFSPIFGTGAGAGMALLYVMSAIAIVLVGIGGYAIRTLREFEKILPNHSENELEE